VCFAIVRAKQFLGKLDKECNIRWLIAVLFNQYSTMEDSPEVNNFYFVNGSHNNYTINLSGNSSLNIFTEGKDIFERIFNNEPKKPKSTGKKKYSGILNSPEAEIYWAKLRKAKIVDKNNQPLNLSWSEKAHLASILADKLDIDDLWKEFSTYWNLDKEALRSSYNKANWYAQLTEFNDKINTILN